jgi:hypothetical protein
MIALGISVANALFLITLLRDSIVKPFEDGKRWLKWVDVG